MHDALSRLGSAEQDRRQHFHQNEGRSKNQVLWIGQIWMIVGGSSLITYGTVSREVLEGDSIAIRDQKSNNEKEDRVIQIMDENRRLFYLPVEKCKSFYELETSTRDRISRPEQGINHYDLSFYLPSEEVLTASRWSSLLKLDDVPLLRVSIEPFSDPESDSATSMASRKSGKSSKPFSAKEVKINSDISLDLETDTNRRKHNIDDATSKSSRFFDFSLSQSMNKFVDFAFVEEGASNRFREILNEVETDLLQIYKYQHSKTNVVIQQVYDAFGSNIYEEAAQQSFEDFKLRRASHAVDGVRDPRGPETSRTKLSTLTENFFKVSVPALQAFVVHDFNASLILKYFGGLVNVMTDPTSSELLSRFNEEMEPDDDHHSNEESKQRWVISRDLIKQADLRFVLSSSTDQVQCPDCERSTIYSSPDKGVSHLRKMHLVGAKTDRVLRDYIFPLPAAVAERLEEEVCELLVFGRNTLASTLRKLVAIQSGVVHDDRFRGSERGIPYYLVEAFKLIVLFVCALPEALHELRWFYHDFDCSKTTQNLVSQKVLQQRRAIDRLGELMSDLIRKAERTLVSPTNPAKKNNAEHFMTSVGIQYLSLQIMFNMFRRPISNRKKASELYAAYANNLGSEIQRNPYKRQILRIGALSSELNLLKDVVELQRGCFDCFAALILPETTHPLLAKQLDRHVLFEIEEGLLSELVQAVKKEDENLDGTLELCNGLKGLVGELTEIMADDQGRAVFVFTVVTITFLPLSFVASYLSMSGGTDGLGMEWGDVQAHFWMVAGPLTHAKG
ncbi:Mg2+ transporter [Colletotrichum higginsianum IMI 349063]|uniref:Mg2+ transporter n=1 Tax=Colletotrichum higginsianum (strain IMI 349063) TaxID=759273 RepID=A0A1B7Y903_COLHI|nr:Mg2+ transporter [Colletotrichum higginsianum IMI 349063]OBR08561.1 Mg2+ transporter [Colletotrichum higginsianum IMI 349063]